MSQEKGKSTRKNQATFLYLAKFLKLPTNENTRNGLLLRTIFSIFVHELIGAALEQIMNTSVVCV